MQKTRKQDDSIFYNQAETIHNFYNKIKFYGFRFINPERIDEIRETAQRNKIYVDNRYSGYSKYFRYIRIMEMIFTSPKKFRLNEDDEKILFLMFSIDPTLEMLKIFCEKNTLKDTKESIMWKFGVFDKNLIKIEKYYIKQFYTNEEKIEFDNEIEKRVFK